MTSSARSYRVFGLISGTLILFGATCFVYGRALHVPFIFDDVWAVENNPSIIKLWPLVGSGEQGGPLNPPPYLPISARPLVNLSFAINYHFGKLDPAGYHIVNFTLHALSAVLLWAIVGRILLLDYFQGQFDRVAGVLSFFAALVWAVHPLNTESVVYITQRTELMMGFFYLATLYASLRYWEAKTASRRWAWLILATVTGALGMVCKEMMASAIAMVLLFERTFLTGSFRQALRKSWPLYLGLALGWLPILAINYHGPRTPLAGFHLGVPAHVWWLTQTKVLLMYLKLAFWPWPLVIHYEVPYLNTISSAGPWLAPVVLLAIATLVLAWRRTASGFVATCMFAVLSPTLLIPMPGETLAERRMYVPLAAIVPLVIVGGFAVAQWLQRHFASQKIIARIPRTDIAATTAVALALAFSFCLVSIRRLASYRDELTIWQDAAIHQPQDVLVQINIATFLAKRGRRQEAIEHFEEALRLGPDPADLSFSHAHYNFGRVLAALGRTKEALEHYEQAVRSRPNSIDAQYNLGLALSSAGRPSEAVEHFQAALRSMPDFAAAHNNLGVALTDVGRVAEAIAHFEQVEKLEPGVESYANLAFAYALTERHADAVATANKAVELARSQGKTGFADELEAWATAYRARTSPP